MLSLLTLYSCASFLTCHTPPHSCNSSSWASLRQSSLMVFEPHLFLSTRGLGHPFHSTVMISCPTSVKHPHLCTGRDAVCKGFFQASIARMRRTTVCANYTCLEERDHFNCRHYVLRLVYRVMANVAFPPFPFQSEESGQSTKDSGLNY